MLDLYKKLIESGLSFIPVNQHTKSPIIGSWKEYQKIAPTLEVAKSWPNTDSIALIGGKVSSGLVCIDFDNAGSEFRPFMQMVSNECEEILPGLVIQRTQSGGYHIMYRCKDVEIGNKKLASNENRSVLIETRSEGGYFLVHPSPKYELLEGNLCEIRQITRDQHEVLIEIAKSFNRLTIEKESKLPQIESTGLSPFDDYNAKNTPLPILETLGWNIARTNGDKVYLRRPGKEKGISASWNVIPDRFYCFSTSTEFENDHVYKASAVYAILTHAGDFSKAASDLYRQGYGDRLTKAKEEKIEQPKSRIIRVRDIMDRIQNFMVNGFEQGHSTGWVGLDGHYTVAKGQLNIITGIPTHGKSEWMDALMVNLAISAKWKFMVYSPENYPFELHFQKLAEKYIKRPIFNEGRLKDGLFESAINFVDTHFRFIDSPIDGISVDEILEDCEKEKTDALLIDPWNELECGRKSDQSETEYIGESLSKLRRFARKKNIAVWVVAHPQKLRRDKDGEYPIPSLYDISGSAHWYNKADNGIVIWRDFEQKKTDIKVVKVKFKNYGSPGEISLQYDTRSGCYTEQGAKDGQYWPE